MTSANPAADVVAQTAARFTNPAGDVLGKTMATRFTDPVADVFAKSIAAKFTDPVADVFAKSIAAKFNSAPLIDAMGRSFLTKYNFYPLNDAISMSLPATAALADVRWRTTFSDALDSLRQQEHLAGWEQAASVAATGFHAVAEDSSTPARSANVLDAEPDEAFVTDELDEELADLLAAFQRKSRGWSTAGRAARRGSFYVTVWLLVFGRIYQLCLEHAVIGEVMTTTGVVPFVIATAAANRATRVFDSAFPTE